MSHTVLFRLLAGKSGEGSGAYWLPLWVHAHDTAEMMKRLVNNRLSEAARNAIGLDADELCRVAWFLGAVHDIGKATRLFQYTITRQLSDVRDRLRSIGAEVTEPRDSGKSHHTLMGEAIALELGCPQGLASIIGAHHGRPQVYGAVEEQIAYPKNYWAQGQKDFWQEVWQDFWQWALEGAGYASAEELPELEVPAELLLTGLLTTADWIASNTVYFPLLAVEELGDETLWPKRANDAWKRLNLTWPWESLCQTMDEAFFTERFGFSPNALQTAVLEVANAAEAPGLLIIEAQMGVGKTEAALAAAEVFAARFQCGGLFFGLPTQATANGIFDRLSAWAGSQSEDLRHAIRLAHGAAEMNENYRALLEGTARTADDDPEAGLEAHPWFEGRKVALLADFVIGTVDQLLMAALKQKHVMLRQLGLAGKVVIVDECHAYDAYMSRYLDRALEWLGRWRVPVILLSATLPAGKRAELVQAYLGGSAQVGDWQTCRAYPLLTWAAQGEVRQTVVTETAAPHSVRLERGVVDDLPQRLKVALREGGCAGVIVNTVRRAQALFETLHADLPEYEIVLFHSQFIQVDRAELERKLVARVGKASTPEDRDRLVVVDTPLVVHGDPPEGHPFHPLEARGSEEEYVRLSNLLPLELPPDGLEPDLLVHRDELELEAPDLASAAEPHAKPALVRRAGVRAHERERGAHPSRPVSRAHHPQEVSQRLAGREGLGALDHAVAVRAHAVDSAELAHEQGELERLADACHLEGKELGGGHVDVLADAREGTSGVGEPAHVPLDEVVGMAVVVGGDEQVEGERELLEERIGLYHAEELPLAGESLGDVGGPLVPCGEKVGELLQPHRLEGARVCQQDRHEDSLAASSAGPATFEKSRSRI